MVHINVFHLTAGDLMLLSRSCGDGYAAQLIQTLITVIDSCY